MMRVKGRSVLLRAVAVLLVLFGLTASAMAASVYPANGDALDASELAAFNAMAAAGDTGAVADLRVFTMTPWTAAAQPGLVVAAMGRDADNFDVAVLKPQGAGWQVVAMANPDNDPVVAPADVSVLEGLSLDVIPYRISKTEIAFVVRVATDFTSTSTYAASTILHLFRLHDGQLDDIFAADVASSTCDKTTPNDACAPDQHAIVAFAATQHGGYYDIVLKSRAGKVQRYIWRDGAYALDGS